MAHNVPPPDDASQQQAGTLAKYILLFAAFGLFGLFVTASKYEQRQAKIEQRFHGIQKMQRDAGRDGAAEPVATHTSQQRPLIIRLRPLMIVISAIALAALLAVLRLNKRPQGPEE
ncbi:MAG: hypothetical protein GTO53_13595 [Planctomycetales bacterium]|nr:hypothetical protein [Planctomycetales bacterium]NIM10125.1 hypothetical protein [Planctomycetales bacterium]NIN08367.1 hypothetical protein [Planctomycetales bacterium]NIN77495.1 hypothetical protein [Planctomycetales bacterium]NIO34667.1 hypothetical protein [Planctomycetales bacterium]